MPVNEKIPSGGERLVQAASFLRWGAVVIGLGLLLVALSHRHGQS